MSREQLIGALAESYDSLLIAADAAVTRGDPPDGGWGLREVLAHIAAWEAEATLRMPALLAGEPDREYDEDAFNAGVVAAIGNQSLNQIYENLKTTHEQLIALLNGLDEPAFKDGSAVHGWVTSLTRHNYEHASELARPE